MVKMNLTNLLIFFVISSSSFIYTVAFESDELLINDDEFEGVVNPIRSSPPIRRPKPDLDSSSSSSLSLDSKAIQFDLEHAFGDSYFSPAGTFTARLKSGTHGGQTLTKMRFSRNALTDAEREAFERLLRDDEFYTIRVPSNVLNSPGKEYVVSSVRAISVAKILRSSRFQITLVPSTIRCIPRESLDEHFIIHTDGVSILAVNYGSAGACQYPRLMKLPKKWSFNSYTVLKTSEQARRTPTFAEEMIQAEAAEGEGVTPPEKSFWAKYWMYLIPLGMIVMNAITQAMNMPDEQTSGQPGAQAQPVTQRAPNGAAVRRR